MIRPQPIPTAPNQADSTLVGSWCHYRQPDGKDYSFSGNDMTPKADAILGRDGVELDGTGDYLSSSVSNYRGSDTSGTFVAWVRTTVTNLQLIVGSSDTATANFYFGPRTNSTTFELTTKAGGTENRLRCDTTAMVVGKWHHVVWTGNGSTYTAYIDGALQSLTVLTGSNSGTWLGGIAGRDNLTIGGLVATGAVLSPWTGQIRDVRFYSEVKTADWIKTEYEKGVPDSSLVLSMQGDIYDESVYRATFTPQADAICGRRYEFDGTGDYLLRTVADWRSADTAGTITAWINIAVTGAHQAILCSADEGSATSLLQFRLRSDNTLLIGEDANGVYGSTIFAANRWYHVAAVSNGSAWSLYVNGAAESLNVTGSNTGQWFQSQSNRDNITIGIDKFSSTFAPFNGKMNDIRVYSEAKSADWIKTYYDKTRSRY